MEIVKNLKSFLASNAVFDAVLIAAAIITVLYYCRELIVSVYYSTACKKWPKAKGRITMSPNTSDVWGDDDGGLRNKIGTTVKLGYEYQVDGIEYHGSNISFKTDVITNSNLLCRMVNMYQVNDEIDVYYHPKKPHISVLNP
ncbi:MAG TPA: DUF3592 domain-containing protein [Chitinivibrionales bacterium]|nr:DUF3592 domain-containing protein [Chitinivibrionales bacterium]